MTRDTLVERLAVLLMTAPDWLSNYTRTLAHAKWVVEEAERVGWTVAVMDEAVEVADARVVAEPVVATAITAESTGVRPKPVAPDQTGRKRTPEQRERMRQGILASYERKRLAKLPPPAPPPSPALDGESPDDRHKRLSSEAADRTWRERHPETVPA